MNKVKILHIVGARPQFVKMALVAEAAKGFGRIESVIVHTGQHYDDNMSDIFFRDLNIPRPKYNLNAGSRSHTGQIGRMIEGLGKVIPKESPEMIFVYGDTNSTLAGAIAGVKCGVPVAHVEAGLRSFNRSMPEEVNRLVIDRISKMLFCPTKTAVRNLREEGITEGVFYCEDVMIEMLEKYSKTADERSRVMANLGIRPLEYYLATIHRAYNTDDVTRLNRLLKALGSLDRRVIFPAHPRTRNVISDNRIMVRGNIAMIEPVSYIDMLMLEKNARAVLTDSGGVQKEAHFFNVPCVTLREETEWVETVRSGWNVLTGVNEAKIRRALRLFSAQPKRRPAVRPSKLGFSPARRMLEIAIKCLGAKVRSGKCVSM